MTLRDERLPALRLGPYDVERVLGRGGMAVVHIARRRGHGATGVQYAVKRILPEFARSASFARLFQREAHLGMRLDHPNVVRVMDFGEQDGELLLVTEYVDGASGSRLLSAARKRGVPVPIPVALHIARQILGALHYIHSLTDVTGAPLGIVHRDLSPGNILLGAMGEVKLADFGVARSLDGTRDTSPGTVVGKLGYMCPEQADGKRVDARGDIYSLGMVLFELLTGRPYFEARDDFELLAQMHEGSLNPLRDARASRLPFELRLILATAVAKSPEDRFTDAAEFSDALSSYGRHMGVTLDRRSVLIGFMRELDIWPVRSGTYPAAHVEVSAEPAAECINRVRSPRS